MKVNDCIEAMINLELDAMIWEIKNCPVDEFNAIYEPNEHETHVIIAKPENDYIAYRMRWINSETEDILPLTILKLNEYFYFYVISTTDANELKQYKASDSPHIDAPDNLPF